MYSLSARQALNLQGVLNIHPFSDGNGRVARIILNHILTYVLPFPINIIGSRIKNRDDYINNIVECRNNKYNHPIKIVNSLVDNSIKLLNTFLTFTNTHKIVEIKDTWLTCIGTLYIKANTMTNENISLRYSFLNHKLRYDVDNINDTEEKELLLNEINYKKDKIFLSEFAYIIMIYL